MDNKLNLIATTFGKEKFIPDEPVANHTVLKTGGPAKLFFIALTPREIVKIVLEARKLKIPFLIFGTGSKIMVSDYGFNGLVIKNRTKNIVVLGVKGKVSNKGIGVDEAFVKADSGVGLSTLVDFLDKQNLQSEDIAGIPGTVGGNLFINPDLQSRVKNIKVINQETEEEEIEAKDLSLSKHIILSAVFRFKSK